MPLTPFIRTEKAARKVLGDTGLFIFMWDSEWNEFAAFAKHGTPFTPQNIRGMLKRTTREKGYALEILEEQMTPNPGGEQVAVTFRFRKLAASEQPPPRKEKVRPPLIPAMAPRYAPIDRTKQLHLELF